MWMDVLDHTYVFGTIMEISWQGVVVVLSVHPIVELYIKKEIREGWGVPRDAQTSGHK